MTLFKNIREEDADLGVRVVTITRPHALNALNSETLSELDRALESAADDRSVKVLVLTGDGEKAFIAGADISEMKDMTPHEALAFSRLGQGVTKRLEMMPKPTIAAVNGFALGGGTEMAIACDFILASANAVFGQPEVGLGVIPGYGGTVRLARYVGWPRAKEMIFSGRRVKADEALRWGLCNRVVPPQELMKEALATARMIAGHSHAAVARCKELMNRFSEAHGFSGGLEERLEAEARTFSGLFGTEDQQKGMTAFLEKRK